MSVRQDVINLQVNVNGNDAQNQLNELRNRARDIKTEMDGLKKGTQEYIAKAAELATVNKEMDGLKKQIGLTALTQKELNAELAKLKALKGSTVPFTKEFNDLQKQIGAVQNRLFDVSHGVQGLKAANDEAASSNGRLVDSFKKVGGQLLEYFGIAFLADKVKEFFTGAIDEANAAEATIANLKNSLQNAGRDDLFETFTADAEKFAQTYERLDPNKILNVFTKLVDYGKLTKAQITSLTDVIINYAAKQKISLDESTDVFTKALEGNSRGLKTYGINIKDAGSFTERFNLITGDLATKIKGAETALENTNKGVWDTFTEHVRRAKEAIGTLIENTLSLTKSQHELAVSAKNEADQGTTLLAQYEELNKKTSKTTEEKTKLKTIEAELVGIFGDSILQINKQTGAYELNIEATKTLIKQKLLLANNDAASVAAKVLKAQDDQAEATKKITLYTDQLTASQKQYNLTLADAYKQHTITFHEPTDEEKNRPEYKLILLDEALKKNKEKLGDAGSALRDYEKQLKDLGFTLEDVSKLITPKDPNAVVGNGDPDGEAKAAAARAAAKKAEEEAAAKHKQLLADAIRFQAELRKLAAEARAGTLSDDEKERALIEEKYSELLTRAHSYWLENSAIGKQATKEIEQIKADQLTALNKKIFQKNSDKEYEDSLSQLNDFIGKEKERKAQEFVDGKITKKEYEAAITDLELRAAQARKQIALDYEGTVKKADQDLTKFKKDELDKQLADAIAAAEKTKKNTIDDTLAEAQLEVLKKPKGSDARLEAEKTLLKLKYELTEKNENDTLNMKLLKQKEYEDAAAQLERDGQAAKFDRVLQYVGFFQQAMQSLNTILSNSENRQLAKEKKDNDDKTKAYKKQLDSKLISQAQYDKNINKLNEEADAKSKEIKKRQAAREKALSIFSILVNTAAAIMQTYKEFGWPIGIPMAIAQGIVGLVQVAAVASAPAPELGRGGHITNGPKHSDSQKGLHLVNPITGRTEMLLERNEAVITSAAMDSTRKMTVSGTPKQIASAINSTHGGVSFAGGAVVSMTGSPWFSKQQPAIRPGIVKMMATGGLISSESRDAMELSNQHLQLLGAVLSSNEGLRDDIRNFNTELTAKVYYKDLKKVGDNYNAAKSASGIN